MRLSDTTILHFNSSAEPASAFSMAELVAVMTRRGAAFSMAEPVAVMTRRVVAFTMAEPGGDPVSIYFHLLLLLLPPVL